MNRFKRQYYAIKEAERVYRAEVMAPYGYLRDIRGYLSALDDYKRIIHCRPGPEICSRYYPLQTLIACYALELEHRRNLKLRKKLHELKQARRAEVYRLRQENALLRAERIKAQFMDMVKGGLTHGSVQNHG